MIGALVLRVGGRPDTESAFEREIALPIRLVKFGRFAASCLIVFDRSSATHRVRDALCIAGCRRCLPKRSEARPSSGDGPDRAGTQAYPKLHRAGLPAALHSATSLDLPSEDEVQGTRPRRSRNCNGIIAPRASSLVDEPENPRLAGRAARSGKAINPASIIGVSHLVDALWERWIEAIRISSAARIS